MIGGRRLAINLAVFAIVAAAVLVRGAVQLLDTQGPSGPALTVVLEATGGLSERTDVTYLGQTVGRIAGLEVGSDRVTAEVRLEDGTELPGGLDARVRRRSAVGEPYLDLRPTDPAASSGALRDGATIPLERTTLPLSYTELFEGVSSLFDAVEPDELGTVIDEFARMVDGRGPELRRLLTDGASVAATLGDGAEVIDEAVTEVGQLTALLAERSDALSGNLDDLRTIGDTLGELGDEFEQAVSRDPTFVARVADLLEGSSGAVTCTVTSLADVVTALDDDTLAGLEGVLGGSERMRELLAATQRHDEHGTWLKTELMLTTEQIEQRTPTGELPDAPEPGVCPEGPAPTPVAEDAPSPSPGRDGPGRTAAPETGPSTGDGDEADDGEPRASSEADPDRGGWPVVWLLVGLLGAAVLATRPWRWWSRSR